MNFSKKGPHIPFLSLFIYIFGGPRWAAVEISHDKADISPAPPRWASGNAPLSATAAHHLPPIRPRLFSIGYSLKEAIPPPIFMVPVLP